MVLTLRILQDFQQASNQYDDLWLYVSSWARKLLMGGDKTGMFANFRWRAQRNEDYGEKACKRHVTVSFLGLRHAALPCTRSLVHVPFFGRGEP
jgi:hypothetical protein